LIYSAVLEYEYSVQHRYRQVKDNSFNKTRHDPSYNSYQQLHSQALCRLYPYQNARWIHHHHYDKWREQAYHCDCRVRRHWQFVRGSFVEQPCLRCAFFHARLPLGGMPEEWIASFGRCSKRWGGTNSACFQLLLLISAIIDCITNRM
jgi:hypothetical protein